MDYYDFYNEPSESEVYFDELKQYLKNEVKDEIKNELEKLRKENKELRDIKRNWNKLKSEYKNKELELEYSLKEAKREAYKIPIKELFDNVRSKYYIVNRRWEKLPKCDKCDDKREVECVDIFGRKHKFKCTCNDSYLTTYIVNEEYITDISEISKRNDKLRMFVRLSYQEPTFSYNDGYYSGTTLINSERVIKDWEQFQNTNKKDIEPDDFLFFNKEDAQKYADELNEELEGDK